MNARLILFCIFCCVENIVFIRSLKKGDRCWDGHSQCAPLMQCPSVLDNVRRGYYPVTCERQGSDIIVCCPDSDLKNNVNDKIIFDNNRKLQDRATRMCNSYTMKACNGTLKLNNPKTTVVGGVPSKPKQFPHMAIIGYGEYRRLIWSCGGSLISERFVLSAAHCASTSMGNAHWVRLGELDVDSKTEDARPQDFEIIERHVHPSYNPPNVYNDIALFKLNRDVSFSDYIRPACLNTLPFIPVEKQRALIASGWGATAYGEVESSVLRYVFLNYVDYKSCKEIYQPDSYLTNGVSESSMICAGYLPGGKDTCLGDSGGPLQFLHTEAGCPLIYKQVGVVSFGKGCALKGSAGLYTKVSYYIPWIESIVWKM